MFVFSAMGGNSTARVKLEQLYQTYRGFMYYIANDVLHNPEDAEDIVHDAFFRIARNIKKISNVDSPRTRAYIAIIVRSMAIDLYRKHRQHFVEDLSEIDESLIPCRSDSYELKYCFSHLSEQERDVILLRYAHGYSVAEIAEILGLSYSATAKIIERAVSKLKKLCEEEGIL